MPRKSSSAEDAFLETIFAHPDDDTPRLVFADWLEEQGNPRGTFIRLQCERAKMTQYDPGWKEQLAKEAALFRQFEAEWSKQVLRYVDGVQYCRGFIEHVRVSATKLLKNGDRLFRAAPVCSIRLENADQLAEIAERPWLAHVKELDLSVNFLGTRSLSALIGSSHLKLNTLRLNECRLGTRGIQVLADSANLGSLRSLHLAGNAVDSEAAQLLARSPYLVQLRELNLDNNQLTELGAANLANAAGFRLTRLSLGSNRLLNDGVLSIARSGHFAELHHLSLPTNEIGNAGLEGLIESAHLRQLDHLNLYHNHINSRGIQALTGSELLGNLTYLDLRHNEIDKPTLQTMTQRLQTPKLRELLF